MKLSEKFWIVDLPRGRMLHLARGDDLNQPRAKTLCGQDTSQRKGVPRYTDTISERVCERCRRKLSPAWRANDSSRDASELKVHLSEGTGAVCGQKLARNLTPVVHEPTSERCLDIS